MKRVAKTKQLTFVRHATGLVIKRGSLDAAAISLHDAGVVFSYITPQRPYLFKAFTMGIAKALMRQWLKGELR